MTAPMEPLAETLTEDARWEAFGLPALAERAANAVLADRGLAPEGFEICVLGCDDARIAVLNADFRGRPTPTNVLAWPSEERGAAAEGAEPPPAAADALGDVAIAWETSMREAAEQGKPAEDHVLHLLVHAMLHLLGYDHIRDGDAEVMEACEIRILAGLGLANPYESA